MDTGKHTGKYKLRLQCKCVNTKNAVKRKAADCRIYIHPDSRDEVRVACRVQAGIGYVHGWRTIMLRNEPSNLVSHYLSFKLFC